MSDQIGVGDRVMLVWGCCASVRSRIGMEFTVSALSPHLGICTRCHTVARLQLVDLEPNGVFESPPAAWLKKIPPGTTPIEQREPSEVTA